MGLGAIATLAVRADLCDRINGLARELPHLSASKLAFAVDDIRRTARDNGLNPLAELARGLEHAIADSGGSTVVLSFLEAMSDAAECQRVDSDTSRSYLAAVGLRLHG